MKPHETDQPDDSREQKTNAIQVGSEKQPDLFPGDLLRVALEVEQQRIESTNRRTDVALQAV